MSKWVLYQGGAYNRLLREGYKVDYIQITNGIEYALMVRYGNR